MNLFLEGVNMQLGKLITRCQADREVVRYPELLNLEVENAEKFCFYALKKYFESEKFLFDVEKCKTDYDMYTRAWFSVWLKLSRNRSGVFKIRIGTS